MTAGNGAEVIDRDDGAPGTAKRAQDCTQSASVPGMFDRIARRYDLLNRLLSGWRDVAWRTRLVAGLPPASDLRVLDVATGTGDVLAAILDWIGDISVAVGVDPAPAMLSLARRKLENRTHVERLDLVRAAAEALPFPPASFDAITVAFGARNFVDLPRALEEMRRVLAPGGTVSILEFSLPRRRIVRGLYLGYLRHVVPRIGSLISGDRAAYQYLNRTVEGFPYGSAFVGHLEHARFERVVAEPLTGGIATIYRGRAG